MVRSRIISTESFNGYPLLPQNKYANKGYYEKILVALQQRYEFMLAQHSQILVIRLQIHYPACLTAAPDNSCFQSFLEDYRQALANNGFSPQILWVREQHHSSNQHYHLVLLLNANKIRSFKGTYGINEINARWGKALFKYYDYTGSTAGLAQIGDTHINDTLWRKGIVVHRDNQAVLNEVFKICSYIAKVATKDSIVFNARGFGASYLPQIEQYGN